MSFKRMRISKAFQRPIMTQEESALLKIYSMQSTIKVQDLYLLIIIHCLPSNLFRSVRVMMRSLKECSYIFCDQQVS